MTEIATIVWFGRWGTSVFSENTAIFFFVVCVLCPFCPPQTLKFLHVAIFPQVRDLLRSHLMSFSVLLMDCCRKMLIKGQL